MNDRVQQDPNRSRRGAGGDGGRTARLFVCAWPSAAAVQELRALARPVVQGVRWVEPAQWHVTLRFLGEVVAADAVDALACAEFPRVTATLGPSIDTFDGRQMIVPVGGVDPLASAVRAATGELGRRDDRRFRGHLTLARVARGSAIPSPGWSIDASFDVESIDLVASETRPGRPVYATVASFACTLTA